MQFVGEEVISYLPSIVREFYSNLRAITEFDADLFANTMCTNPVPMGGFMHKEFTPGKLKPKYALMNKVIHNMIRPKGKEKLPSKEEIQFLYEVMNGKIIDYSLVM